MTDAPTLPEGWSLDPHVTDHRPEDGIWWVITDTGLRTAWNAEKFQNANDLVCPVCAGHPDQMIDCQECSGRGLVDTVPYCERPWDLIASSDQTGGELWLGGIHCQFGGAAAGPTLLRTSDQGNAYPHDYFDVVVSMLHAPGYEPSEGVEHHEYRIADADLDPGHHTHLDSIADRIKDDYEDGKLILVRCQAGINRSALVSSLVLLKLGIPLDDILRHLRQERSPYVLFNKSFVAYLREVEARG